MMPHCGSSLRRNGERATHPQSPMSALRRFAVIGAQCGIGKFWALSSRSLHFDRMTALGQDLKPNRGNIDRGGRIMVHAHLTRASSFGGLDLLGGTFPLVH